MTSDTFFNERGECYIAGVLVPHQAYDRHLELLAENERLTAEVAQERADYRALNDYHIQGLEGVEAEHEKCHQRVAALEVALRYVQRQMVEGVARRPLISYIEDALDDALRSGWWAECRSRTAGELLASAHVARAFPEPTQTQVTDALRDKGE